MNTHTCYYYYSNSYTVHLWSTPLTFYSLGSQSCRLYIHSSMNINHLSCLDKNQTTFACPSWLCVGYYSLPTLGTLTIIPQSIINTSNQWLIFFPTASQPCRLPVPQVCMTSPASNSKSHNSHWSPPLPTHKQKESVTCESATVLHLTSMESMWLQ